VTDYVIEAVNLEKKYGDLHVVKGINFKMPRGKCFGFLGPNGAGKTTTIRMIMGLSPITAGSLTVLGYSIPEAGEIVRAKVGVVPQGDTLDPDFTVLENLLVYASYYDLPKAHSQARAKELLTMMELNERAHMKPGTLSGGMRRRLTIARALINDPELIILDEPTTGLDPQVRHLIWAKMRDLLKQGKSLLLTTHYMEEAERLCDELVIMDAGDIIKHGSPAAIIKECVEPEVLEIKLEFSACQTLLQNVPGIRFERVGDSAYCYTRDSKPVVDRLQEYNGVSYLHRPANLEDVFLAMTGRELRD
jgi:lipooligosaccharide transport system ATP-binding protein